MRRTDWLVGQLPVGMMEDGFFLRFVSLFQELATGLLEGVDNIPNSVDVTVAPPALVRWLGSWIGVENIDSSLPVDLQRRIVEESALILAWRGTRKGLVRFLELVTDGPVEVVDSGGVFAAGEVGIRPAQVWIRVDSTGWVPERDFVALLHDELPADVAFEVYVRDRRLWPPLFQVGAPQISAPSPIAALVVGAGMGPGGGPGGWSPGVGPSGSSWGQGGEAPTAAGGSFDGERPPGWVGAAPDPAGTVWPAASPDTGSWPAPIVDPTPAPIPGPADWPPPNPAHWMPSPGPYDWHAEGPADWSPPNPADGPPAPPGGWMPPASAQDPSDGPPAPPTGWMPPASAQGPSDGPVPGVNPDGPVPGVSPDGPVPGVNDPEHHEGNDEPPSPQGSP
ncbi:MAG: phage tail protein [Acidimicrobiales bacterium]